MLRCGRHGDKATRPTLVPARPQNSGETKTRSKKCSGVSTVEIVYNDIGYNDEPDITTEL